MKSFHFLRYSSLLCAIFGWLFYFIAILSRSEVIFFKSQNFCILMTLWIVGIFLGVLGLILTMLHKQSKVICLVAIILNGLPLLIPFLLAILLVSHWCFLRFELRIIWFRADIGNGLVWESDVITPHWLPGRKIMRIWRRCATTQIKPEVASPCGWH